MNQGSIPNGAEIDILRYRSFSAIPESVNQCHSYLNHALDYEVIRMEQIVRHYCKAAAVIEKKKEIEKKGPEHLPKKDFLGS